MAGKLVHFELPAQDDSRATQFYGELFGWKVATFGGGEDAYLTIRNGDSYNGGIRQLDREGAPPHWLVYFGADDVGAALDRVDELGGKRLSQPIEMQMGSIGIAQDPQGAVFALFAGRFEP